MGHYEKCPIEDFLIDKLSGMILKENYFFLLYRDFFLWLKGYF
nr:MAG TPA: hypothetical protein [Caudoviricetes sp.]